MVHDRLAAVLAAPPWPQVTANAASSDRMWIPWTRRWMWGLLCTIMAFQAESSTLEVQRPEGVITSSGNVGTSEALPARGDRPKTPVLRLDLGEVIIDPPPRLPPSGAGTFWIKDSSGSSASKTDFGKRSADSGRPRNPPSQDCLAADASAVRHADTVPPSAARDLDLADVQSCAGCGGSPSVPIIGADPGTGRSGQWGAGATQHKRPRDGGRDGNTYVGPVLIEPPVLNLGVSQLCIPTSAEVVVWNEGQRSCAGQGCSGDASRSTSTANAEDGAGWTDEENGRDETVHLLSVTSNNPQFHPTSFRPQALPPDGHTSFQVVFLPRAIGDADAVLTVATSAGDVSYKVQAEGVLNPYKVQPVVESRISMGSTFTHPIVVSNPRDSPTLSITEIYTTEGFLHLVMPTDSSSSGAHGNPEMPAPRRNSRKCSRCAESDSTAFRDPPPEVVVDNANHPRSAWRIPPGAELEIIRLSFHAEIPGNFQGYIHIRTDRESLVVPVELHVSTGGVDPTPSEVDFGVLTSPAERRQASISLFNSGTEPLLIVGARISHADPRINVGFRDGTIIPAGARRDDAVRLVYSGGEPTLEKGERQIDTSPSVGKVVIAVNHTLPELSVVEIDYRAHVLHGGVAYDWGQVSFQVGVESASSRQSQGLPKADPPSGMATQVNVPSDGGEVEQSWGSFNESGVRSSGEEGERERRGWSLPAVETRVLDLKNHFPTAIQLLSLTVEKCEDILSVSSVDPDDERSVALPQESWSDISLSFHRSIFEASGGHDFLDKGGFRAYAGHGESHPVTPSPSLVLEVPDSQAVERDHSFPAFEPLSPTSAGSARSGWSEDDHPTTITGGGESGVSGKGALEAVPSVSADQRTPAQKALDEHSHAHSSGSGGTGVNAEESSTTSFPLLRPSSAPFACVLRAETNASTHHIPLFVFDGSLHFSLLEMEGGGEQEGFGEDLEGKVQAGTRGRRYNVEVEKDRRAARRDWPAGSSSRLSLAASAGLPPDSRSRRFSKYTGAAASHSGRWETTQSAGRGGAEQGTETESSPTVTPPLVVHLGIVRAGTTARRRFNVTNLNPVEVNITTNELGGGVEGVPFTSLRLLGTEPLPSAPLALLEISKHLQDNQEPSATSHEDRSDLNAAATWSATQVLPAGGDGPDPGRQNRQGQAPGPPLGRENVVEREVSCGPPVGGDDGVVCALAPGSLATFEVEATAPEPGEMAKADRAVRMEVRGLLLSTPAETVPVLVTYDAVRGGMFFHASPLKTMVDKSMGALVAVHLDRAFPGRSAVSGVSLRSTASWESRVERMESSGPRVQATLTRRNVPGSSTLGGGGDFIGEDESDTVVEVGWVEYNASSRDCAGLDAWKCLARQAEEVVARESGYVEDGGSPGTAGPTKGNKKGALARTFLGMVGRLCDDTSITLAHGTSNTRREDWVGSASSSAGPRGPGCHRPRLSDDGGDWSDEDHAGVGSRPVRQDTARASIELWRMLPALEAAGINRFREEVTVRTTLGQAETPLSVIVSMTVPSLVVGAAANNSAVKRPGFPGSDDVDRYAPVRFPLTKVGDMREMFIEIRNPAEVPVSVRLAAAEDKSSSWTEASPREESGHADPSVAPAASQHVSVSEGMLSAVGDVSPVVMVAPGASAALGPVRFSPSKEGVFSTHVYLVNNLTQVEPVLLEGEAGTGRLVIRPLVLATPESFQASSTVAPAEADRGYTSGNSSDVAAGVGEMEEKRDGYGDEEYTVVHFPVDFRSWARSPPTTEPVVKHWVLSNQGTMPLVLDGLGIRMEGKERTWLGGGILGGDWGGVSARGNSVIRLLMWVISGMTRENTAPRGWSGAAAAVSTAAIARGASSVLCSDVGFRVNSIGKEACEGWRPQTLPPGEEIEVVVGYTAAHCDPVNRTLDVFSSSGIFSIRMMASACGGPSAVAACRSARRAAAAVKLKDSKTEAATAIDRGGRSLFWGGRHRRWGWRGRWNRALFVIKMAFVVVALYGVFTVLWPGRDLPPLSGWVRRLQARAAGCIAASSRGCGGFAVSVEVRASAAVVVSSPPPPVVPLVSAAAASRAPFEGSTSSREKLLTSAQRLPKTAGSPTLEAFDPDASPSPSNPSSDGGHEEAVSLVPTEVGHEDVIEEEHRTDENAAARQNVATDDIDRAPSGGAALATFEIKPLVVVPEALRTGRFDKAEGGNESPGRVAMGDRDGHYIASSPSPSASVTAAVEILSSPGQASRPNRLERPTRAPPAVEETDDHGGKRVMSPPLSSRVVRQQYRAAGSAASKTGEVARSPSRPARRTPETSKQSTGGQNAKRGSGGSTVGTAMRDSIGGPSPLGGSPLHHQKANRGRFSPPGGGGGRAVGTPHKGGSGNSNNRTRGQGYHQHRPTHAIRGGPRQQRGHGPVRPPLGRSLPYDHLSLSSSHFSSAAAAGAVTYSLNPPALASPAASIATVAMDNHNRQLLQQQQDGGALGDISQGAFPPPSVVSGSYGFSRRDQHHRPGGVERERVSGGAPTTRSSLTGQHTPGTASSDWMPTPTAPGPWQSPFLVSTGHHNFRSVDNGVPSGTDSFAAGRLLQGPPSSGQWGIDRVPFWSPPCALSATGRISPPLAPIGSNRLRAKPYGSGPVGTSMRPPPGLTPPPPNQASSYLPHASAERTLAPASSGFSTTEEADWSDNLDAFATASAVVAGVLSAEDMSDAPTPISPLSPFGRMPGRQDLDVFGEDLLSARRGGNGSRLQFYMSAPPSASGPSVGGPSGNAGIRVQEDSSTASSFGSTEKQLLFGTSEDGVHGSGMLSFMYEGDEG